MSTPNEKVSEMLPAFSATDTGSSGTFGIEAVTALFNLPSTTKARRSVIIATS